MTQTVKCPPAANPGPFAPVQSFPSKGWCPLYPQNTGKPRKAQTGPKEARRKRDPSLPACEFGSPANTRRVPPPAKTGGWNRRMG